MDIARGPRRRRGPVLIGSAIAIACTSAGMASAQSTDTTTTTTATTEEQGTATELAAPPTDGSEAQQEPTGTDGETTDEAGTDDGANAEKRKAGRLTLLLEDASPRKIYFYGKRRARFKFKFNGANRADLLIEVMKLKDGKDAVVRRYKRNNHAKGDTGSVRWNGRRGSGKMLKRGKFYFRVKERGGKRLKRGEAKGQRNLRMFPAKFPVRGPHQYWDGWGAGRGHQGQDIGASCGTPMVAAEPGKVVFKGYDGGGWGHYIVINVRRSNWAALYSHLQSKPGPNVGSMARTGQRIGRVGESGNASGCHLHFEYWKGKWPNGYPTPMATKRLKRWDKWS